MAFEKLKACPLIETVCELRFAQSVQWDAKTAELLHARLKTEFPKAIDAPRKGIEVQVDPAKGPVTMRALDSSRVQFRRADDTALIQVDDRMVSANMLAPYTGWEAGFLPIIRSMITAVREVLPAYQLARIGLRYINQIALQSEAEEPNHYLTTMPMLEGTLAQVLHSSFQRFELIHSRPQGILVLQTGLRRRGDSRSIMLDLDFVSDQVSEMDSDARVFEWLESAHDVVIRSFNDSLSPETYRRLQQGA